MLIKIESYNLTTRTINAILLDNAGTNPIDLTGLLDPNVKLQNMIIAEKTVSPHSAEPVSLGILTYALGTTPANGQLTITYTDTPGVVGTTDIVYLKQGSSVKTTTDGVLLSGIINTASINETLDGDGTTSTSTSKMLAGIGTDQAGTNHKLVIRLVSADGEAITSEEMTLATPFSINGTNVAYIDLVTDVTGPVVSDELFNYTVTYYNAAHEELILLDSSKAAVTAYLKRA